MKGFTPPPRLSLSSEPLPITRAITIPEGISVKDLAEKLEIRAKDLIARLLARGVFATVNQTLDSDLASDMARHFGAEHFGHHLRRAVGEGRQVRLSAPMKTAALAVTRPPVVTIMGHVDHGKTSLLDAIRSTNVAEGEAGGITQHIGAYKVAITDPNSPAFGREIVFLDTPGHEAFTRMRARGSKVTDIVVLVVAADDGVMPQTLEAIDHAKAANVPIIVAVNKIDKPDAQPDRVKKQLADRGLMPEDWGGSTVFVDVSAKQKTNLNLLMEMVCLVADLQRSEGRSRPSGDGYRAGSQARSRTRSGGDRSGTERHAAHQRQLRRRQCIRQGSRHVQRSRRCSGSCRAVHSGRDSWAGRIAAGRRSTGRRGRSRKGARYLRIPRSQSA